MANKWIWFNIGQKGLSNVRWQCAVIKNNFDPNTIKFEDGRYDEENDTIKEIWVEKSKLSYDLDETLSESFSDLKKVAEWVKTSYELEKDIYVGHNNYLHIYNVFDLDDKNEYGIAKGEWI